VLRQPQDRRSEWQDTIRSEVQEKKRQKTDFMDVLEMDIEKKFLSQAFHSSDLQSYTEALQHLFSSPDFVRQCASS
jgi:uncharacterized protein YhaN